MFPTPLSVDTYPRTMVEGFDERAIISVPTGFQSFFGNPLAAGKTHFSPNALDLDIEILRGNEKLAAMIQRGSGGRSITGVKNTNEQKSSAISRLFPLIEEEGDITADQINKRVMGENPHSPITKEMRMQLLAMNIHQEHVRRTVRTFELLASISILTGTQPALIGTTKIPLTYDFYRSAGNTITVGTAWDGVSPTIMADIDGGCEQGRIAGHVKMDMGIIGTEALDATLSDTDFQTKADNRRFGFIEIDSDTNPLPARFSRAVQAGFQPRGKLKTAGGYEIWLFTYIDVYTDSAGATQNFMPKDKMVLLSSGARFDRYFGPSETLPQSSQQETWMEEMFGFSSTGMLPPNVTNVDDVVTPAMFSFDAYPSNNNKQVTIRTQAAPIFATTQTDAVVVLDGLIT